MSEILLVGLIVLLAFAAALALAEWAASHWGRARRHGERAVEDDLVDWPFDEE